MLRGSLESLSALRVASLSYTEPEPGVGNVVNMDLQKLSLPSGGVAGVPLADHLEGPVKNMVLRFEDFMLEDADSWILKEGLAKALMPACAWPCANRRTMLCASGRKIMSEQRETVNY